MTKPLYERFRPASWTEVVGQDKAVQKIARIRAATGFGGQAIWLAGASGTGKTTIARLIAAEIADPWDTLELDAVDMTPAKLDEIEQGWHYAGFRGGRAYIINEAHGLRGPAIKKLLVMLERQPSHVVVIFTTTIDGQDSLFEDQIDAHPLLSRCHVLTLARRDITKPFAHRLMYISAELGKQITHEQAEKLLRRADVGNNLRRAIQLLATEL